MHWEYTLGGLLIIIWLLISEYLVNPMKAPVDDVLRKRLAGQGCFTD